MKRSVVEQKSMRRTVTLNKLQPIQATIDIMNGNLSNAFDPDLAAKLLSERSQMRDNI